MTDSKAPPNDPKYLTVKQTAEYLQISERTVWKYLETGRLERILLGPKLVRISRESIENLMKGGDNGYHRD